MVKIFLFDQHRERSVFVVIGRTHAESVSSDSGIYGGRVHCAGVNSR